MARIDNSSQGFGVFSSKAKHRKSSGTTTVEKSFFGRIIFEHGISKLLEFIGKPITIDVSNGNVHLTLSEDAMAKYMMYLEENPDPVAVITLEDKRLMDLISRHGTKIFQQK